MTTFKLKESDAFDSNQHIVHVDLWESLDDIASSMNGLTLKSAIRILDERTRRMYQALNRVDDESFVELWSILERQD